MAVKDKTGAKQHRKSAERPVWNCRKEAFAWVSATASCRHGKNLYLPKQQNSMAGKDKTGAKQHRKSAERPFNCKKQAFAWISAPASTSCRHGNKMFPEQHNSMAGKGKTGAKQHRKSAERPFWNCKKEAFAWVSATASITLVALGKSFPPEQQIRQQTPAEQ